MTVETLNPTVNSKWRLDADIAGSFVQVRAMSSFTPAVNPTVQDASDYDSEGWGTDAKTLRKNNPTLVLMRKEGATGYDPGQEALRQAADDNTVITCRYYERGVVAGEAYEADFLVNWEPQGGTVEGLSVVNVSLLGQGAPRVIATPTGSAVPTVSSVSPASGPAAGGDLVTISGSGFTGATAVTFDGVAASDFTVISSTRIAAVTPAGVAGDADVVVTNATGASTTGTAAYEYV